MKGVIAVLLMAFLLAGCGEKKPLEILDGMWKVYHISEDDSGIKKHEELSFDIYVTYNIEKKIKVCT